MITKKSIQNLNALMFLAAIYEYKSKRKASEVLNTSIDTVNKYVGNLEHNLGMQLTVNDTKGCRLTPRAKNIVDKVKDIEGLLETINSKAPNSNNYRGDVSICVPFNVSINFLQCHSADFYNKFPNIKIISTSTADSLAYEDLDADIALATKEPTSKGNFSLLHKKEMPCGLFASEGYLKKYGCPKNVKDLQHNHRLVHVYNEYEGLGRIDDIVEGARDVRFLTNSGICAASVIKNGVGIGVLPIHYQNEGFKLLDNMGNIDAIINIYLLVNNRSKDSLRVRAVAEHYRNALEEPFQCIRDMF